MDRLLGLLLRRFVRRGTLRITTANGTVFTFGDGTGQPVAIRFMTAAAQRGVILDPEIRLGESYMDGTLRVEDGTIADFLGLVLGQSSDGMPPDWARLQWTIRYIYRRLQQFNRPIRARRNVAHHYDLDGRLYSLFLDSDRQYSCAYFEHPNASLDDAQLAKKRHLAAKLLVNPDARVLDIGSGWGGLAIYLAKFFNAKVTGITLSTEQLGVARERAAEQDLAGSLEFRLQDYRDVTDKFDRIVSVGMFEHVGVHHYGEFFGKVNQLMTDDGVMLLHSIGHMSPPGTASPWLRKYIFPGAYSPALSEVFTAVEQNSLWVTDLEFLRLHYAKTLAHWERRFQTNRAKVAQMYDERFCRMWEFYLISAEMMFRTGSQLVFHMQLAKKRDAAPIVRDYVTDMQRAYFKLESERLM